jgi:hypothetical protein
MMNVGHFVVIGGNMPGGNERLDDCWRWIKWSWMGESEDNGWQESDGPVDVSRLSPPQPANQARKMPPWCQVRATTQGPQVIAENTAQETGTLQIQNLVLISRPDKRRPEGGKADCTKTRTGPLLSGIAGVAMKFVAQMARSICSRTARKQA